MGYPGPPPQWQPEDVDRTQVERAVRQQAAVQAAVTESAAAMMRDNANSNSDNDAMEMHCDVVVVGSGAGGCVAAHNLAAAGYRVIVVEKGAYQSPDDITLQEVDAMDQQYEQHGLLQTTDGVVMLLAGSGLGGGTAINWSCCLALPDYVRQEWCDEHGLTAFATNASSSSEDSEYDRALQTVLVKMGAADRSRVTDNAPNQRLQEGCEALHYQWETTGQNLRDTSDVAAAGYIGLGDRYGIKTGGGVQAFLEPAVRRHGVQIVDRCRVDRVLFGSVAKNKKDGSQRRRATGVQCTVMGSSSSSSSSSPKQLTIHARQSVILAAGALHTPCLLQRSGFGNRHIGRHLRLHPATAFLGFARRGEKPVDAIYGAPMTTVCNQFARGPSDDKQHNYGVKIECPVAYPGIMASAMNWTSPEMFRDRLQRYRSAIPLILVQRDSGEGGSVRAARDGSLVIKYKLNQQDKESLIRGLQGSAEILVAAGAEEVGTGHIRDAGFKPGQA